MIKNDFPHRNDAIQIYYREAFFRLRRSGCFMCNTDKRQKHKPYCTQTSRLKKSPVKLESMLSYRNDI